MAMQSELRLAVLIDADNASKDNLKAIMDEVAKYGVPTIKHAYGDWAKRPDFDSRNYGYSQLSKMLRAIPRFEVGGAGSHVWVKDKEAK